MKIKMSLLDALLAAVTYGNKPEMEYLKQKYFHDKLLAARTKVLNEYKNKAGRKLTTHELMGIDILTKIFLSYNVQPLISKEISQRKFMIKDYLNSRHRRRKLHYPRRHRK